MAPAKAALDLCENRLDELNAGVPEDPPEEVDRTRAFNPTRLIGHLLDESDRSRSQTPRPPDLTIHDEVPMIERQTPPLQRDRGSVQGGVYNPSSVTTSPRGPSPPGVGHQVLERGVERQRPALLVPFNEEV